MFQLMFAVITVALISGAVADRMKFLAWGIFAAVWATLVCFPVAHWVFDFGDSELGGSGAGWLANLGVLDFAGGTAVHINAGAAGLALVLILGRRIGFGKVPMKPLGSPALTAKPASSGASSNFFHSSFVKFDLFAIRASFPDPRAFIGAPARLVPAFR